MKLSIDLTDEENKILKDSLILITNSKIEVFVVNFYEAFLTKQTLAFIKRMSNASLINMFTAFLNIIMSYLEDPTVVDENAELLLMQHPQLKELISFGSIFNEAFMKSLKKSLDTSYTDELGLIWFKSVENFIAYLNESPVPEE